MKAILKVDPSMNATAFMTKMLTELKPEFSEFIPADLEDGILYVSLVYNTASHLCPCGCKNRVVTPLGGEFWQITYTLASVTLSPSIGNWQIPCRSHYFIRDNKIVQA